MSAYLSALSTASRSPSPSRSVVAGGGCWTRPPGGGVSCILAEVHSSVPQRRARTARTPASVSTRRPLDGRRVYVARGAHPECAAITYVVGTALRARVRAAGSQRSYAAVAGAHLDGPSARRASPIPAREGARRPSPTPPAVANNEQRRPPVAYNERRLSTGRTQLSTQTTRGLDPVAAPPQRHSVGLAGRRRSTSQRRERGGRHRAGATLRCCGGGLRLRALDSPWLRGTPPSSVRAEAAPRVVSHWRGGPMVDRHKVRLTVLRPPLVK